MPAKIRRVVTGHNAEGKAVVKIDEIVAHSESRRKGAATFGIWSTDTTPADISGEEDGAERAYGGLDPDRTIFRFVEYQPGCEPRPHRTESIDYAVVISGEIDMELDDSTVHLKAGDVLVQRGTVHNWVNNGSEPCIIAFALIHAELPTFGEDDPKAFG